CSICWPRGSGTTRVLTSASCRTAGSARDRPRLCGRPDPAPAHGAGSGFRLLGCGMLTRVRRALTFAASAAAAAQVGVAATWVPGVRRMLVPSLLGRGRPSSVALTFDDGPHPQGTPAMLDTLDQLGWKAT